jgi:hypothetical protein
VFSLPKYIAIGSSHCSFLESHIFMFIIHSFFEAKVISGYGQKKYLHKKIPVFRTGISKV